MTWMFAKMSFSNNTLCAFSITLIFLFMRLILTLYVTNHLYWYVLIMFEISILSHKARKKIMLCFLFPAGWELRLRPGGREIYFFINYFLSLENYLHFLFWQLKLFQILRKLWYKTNYISFRKLMSKWAKTTMFKDRNKSAWNF